MYRCKYRQNGDDIYIWRWQILHFVAMILWNHSMVHIPLWHNVWLVEWLCDVFFSIPVLFNIIGGQLVWSIANKNPSWCYQMQYADRTRRDGTLNLWPCQMFYGDLEDMK